MLFTQEIKLNRLLLMLVLGVFASAAVAEETDKRQILKLSEPQREHVLQEMRSLLSGTQSILDALAKDDMAAVAQQARLLGMTMAHKAEDHLKGALPQEFMKLGMAVRQDFDQIAADAESIQDTKHSLSQLSASMSKCVACHATYQIRTQH